MDLSGPMNHQHLRGPGIAIVRVCQLHVEHGLRQTYRAAKREKVRWPERELILHTTLLCRWHLDTRCPGPPSMHCPTILQILSMGRQSHNSLALQPHSGGPRPFTGDLTSYYNFTESSQPVQSRIPLEKPSSAGAWTLFNSTPPHPTQARWRPNMR